MSKKGLPLGLRMRHDSHYVDELTKSHKFIGRLIQIAKIEPNPEQPRVEMGDLGDLVASIREKGVLEPLLVKPLRDKDSDKWLIIAGERRWRAAQIAGLVELPCIELNVGEQEVAEIALIENLQRKDLTIWEEADAYQALCERFNYTHEDLARKISKSRSSVTESLTIGTLPPAVRQKCIEAGISSKAAILKIARKFDEREMFEEINKNLESEIRLKEISAHSDKIPEVQYRENNLNSSAEPHKTPDDRINSSFPLRVYKFNDQESGFKLEVKFKKPVGVKALKDAFYNVLKELDDLDSSENN